MVCTSVRDGQECPFMTGKGCSYNGGICHEVVEQCNGCNRNVQFGAGWFCAASPQPELKWKNSNCNLATHVKAAAVKAKQKINPLKASKRTAR